MAGSKKTLSIEMRLRDFASKNLDKIQGKTARMAAKMVKGFKKVGKAITSVKGLMVGFIAVLAVRRVASFVLGIVEMEDKISKMARSIQSTTEELSSFQFALERSGLEVSKAATLLRAFGTARSLAFRAEDKGLISDQTTAFKLLGISVNDLKTKGTIEIIRQMAQGIADLGDISAAQTALQSIFPRDFQAITILLGEGSAAFDKLISDSKRFGATLSGAAGLEAEKFLDTMTNFTTVIRTTFRDVVNLFLPDIGRIIEGLTETLVENREAFIGLAVSALEFVQTIARETFGAVFSTFEAINDLLNRTKREVLADIKPISEELDRLLSSGTSSSGRSQEIFKLRKRLEALNEELATFPDFAVASAKFEEAMAKMGMAIKEAGEEAEKGAINLFNLNQNLESTEPLKVYAAALRSIGEEASFADEEGLKLLETARQLEALPAAFIGPTRPGQKQDPLPPQGPPAGLVPPRLAGTPIGGDGAAAVTNLDQLLQKTREVQKTLDDLSIGEGFQQGILDATRHLDSLGEVGAEIAFTLQDNLVGAADAFIDGVRRGEDAYRAFARVMLREIQKIIVQLAIAAALQAALSGGGGSVTSTAPGPDTGLSAAKGGVFPEFGGRFGHGGIAPGRSQLINVGEGGRREAVVPLPDNRSIPVDLRGAGGFNITNNFHFQGSSGESLEQVRRNRNEIVAIINRSIQNNEGGMRRTIQEIGK